MPFPPDVYLIGAQKAGTTTLAYLLSQHPDICVAKSKEPHYFTANSSKDIAWYREQFPNYENKICIDASTSYSFAPISLENSYRAKKCFYDIPQRIYSLNPHAKFIYLLRDPVDRTYSSYWHSFNTGREHRNFSDAIENDYFYLDVSNYYGQLDLWLKYFPMESFLFLLFEDMKQNPKLLLKKCFDFIGLDSENIVIDLGEPKNQSRSINVVGRKFNRIFKKLDYSGLGYLAPSPARNFIANLTTNHNKVLPKMSEQERAFLQEYFGEKNEKLALLTGINLSQWQSQ